MGRSSVQILRAKKLIIIEEKRTSVQRRELEAAWSTGSTILFPSQLYEHIDGILQVLVLVSGCAEGNGNLRTTATVRKIISSASKRKQEIMELTLEAI